MNEFQKGVSLLELMLVMVIAVLFFILSLRYYDSYKKTQEVAVFQTTLSELMNALNTYYYANCAQNSILFKTLDIKKLQEFQSNNKLRLIGNITNPLGDFTVGIVDKNKNNFYALQVTATLYGNNIKLADYIRGALNGDAQGMGTNVVTWTRLPLYGLDDLSSRQWIMNQGAAQEFMPGRFTTAMNTGLSSKFWVLNSNLQLYRQLNADEDEFPNTTICPN